MSSMLDYDIPCTQLADTLKSICTDPQT